MAKSLCSQCEDEMLFSHLTDQHLQMLVKHLLIMEATREECEPDVVKVGASSSIMT